MNRSLTRFSTAVATLALLAGAAACSDADSSAGTNPTPPKPAGDSASVRVVHASPDAPAVDVWVEGLAAPIVSGAGYGAASPYVTVPAGTYTIQLRAAPSKASDPIAFSVSGVTIAAGAKITAIAAGLLSSNAEADKFRILPLAEQFTPASGQAKVRIVHASADAPAVGIDVGNDDPAAPEVGSLARFADTGAAGVALPAGQALQVGITAGGAKVTAFTTPMLPADGELFVIATGRLGKAPRATDGFSLLAVAPSGAIGFIKQNPVVYALHASPDAPAVDVFAGSGELADNLAFGGLSAPIQVPPGSYNLDFFPHASGAARPAGAPATSQSTGALEAGQRYLAVASGFLAATPAFALSAFADEFDTADASRSRLRAIHSSPDAPAVDIGVVSGGSISPVLVPNIAFPAATPGAGLDVAPGPYTLGVTPAGNNTSIVAQFGITAAPGQRAFVVAAGALAPAGGAAPFRLLVVETKATPWTVASVNPNPT